MSLVCALLSWNIPMLSKIINLVMVTALGTRDLLLLNLLPRFLSVPTYGSGTACITVEALYYYTSPTPPGKRLVCISRFPVLILIGILVVTQEGRVQWLSRHISGTDLTITFEGVTSQQCPRDLTWLLYCSSIHKWYRMHFGKKTYNYRLRH